MLLAPKSNTPLFVYMGYLYSWQMSLLITSVIVQISQSLLERGPVRCSGVTALRFDKTVN